MNKILTLTFAILVLGTSTVMAQKYRVPSKSSKTEMKLGDRFYAEASPYTAAEFYKDAVRQDSSNRYATFWLAMSLLQARDYENAEVFFRKFYSIKPGPKDKAKKWAEEDDKLFNKGGYYFGQVLHRNGKYDEAIEYLNKFVHHYKPVDETDNLLELAKLEIAGCEFAKTSPKAKVKVNSLGNGINHSYTESSPSGIADSILYYSSLRIDNLTGGDTLIFYDGTKNKRTYAIYRSIHAGNTWLNGRLVENQEINDPKYTVGNGVFNKDLTRFYFTKCLEMDDDRPLCNLFVADHKDGKFSNVTRIPEPINEKEKYTSTQPSVRTSEDGMEIIYFSSDRPGGAGGYDIWYFLRSQNGDFKGPKVVKGSINTAADELTPFFDDSTKTLYFSSNGHPGYGGFDVFKSTEQQDLGWSEVLNQGSPINTGADDLYYSRSSDQTFGFMVSNRVGSVPLNGIKTASDDIFGWQNFKYGVQGMAFKEGGEEGGGALTGGVFKLYRKEPDGTKVLVGVDSSKAAKDGFYFFKLNPETDYEIAVERPGYQPKIEAISTKGLPDEDTLQNNLTVKKGIYAAFGDIFEEANPSVKIKDAYVSLTEMDAGYERTLFNSKTGANSSIYYFDLEMNKDYKISARKEGYFSKTVMVSTKNRATTDSIKTDIGLPKLEIGKDYTLQNVLYEFGKATLTENSKQVLDQLYTIMIENPTFVIELSAHTDAIGSDAANLKLSQARAQSCVDYLKTKGIATERMIPKGYGESKPKVPNTTDDGKDDPAGRAINRRTEFKILKS
ncbi:MAG: OmpA family protein [Chitinophagales bacterium]